jgi:hypothetical protein
MDDQQPSQEALEYARKAFVREEHDYIWLDTPLYDSDSGSGLLINIDCENTPEHLYDAVARHLDAFAADAIARHEDAKLRQKCAELDKRMDEALKA